jgi:hypothetical protein
MAQLLDLREDWGKILAIPTLQWDGGCSPPLRIIVEFVVAATAWLTGTNQTGTLLGAAEKQLNLKFWRLTGVGQELRGLARQGARFQEPL